jgi:hypothetical protein
MPATTLDSRTALIVIDLQKSLERIFPRLGETGATQEIIDLVHDSR